jgi:hypothetical protein
MEGLPLPPLLEVPLLELLTPPELLPAIAPEPAPLPELPTPGALPEALPPELLLPPPELEPLVLSALEAPTPFALRDSAGGEPLVGPTDCDSVPPYGPPSGLPSPPLHAATIALAIAAPIAAYEENPICMQLSVVSRPPFDRLPHRKMVREWTPRNELRGYSNSQCEYSSSGGLCVDARRLSKGDALDRVCTELAFAGLAAPRGIVVQIESPQPVDLERDTGNGRDPFYAACSSRCDEAVPATGT